MNFEIDNIYHIYNQGNNRQKVFFKESNYLFFKEKIKRYILPYADVLAWCLMPNHFHLMVYVREVEVLVESDGFTQSEAITQPPKTRTLNNSIGIMLRSYTRAINKQENCSGAIFRPQTKAICLSQRNGITPAFIETGTGTELYRAHNKKTHSFICFNYIHQNSVVAKLVDKPEDWRYSSALHYTGTIDDGITNKKRAHELGFLKNDLIA